MDIGAHVRAGGTLVGALARGAEIGADSVQVFTQSPRAWKPTQYAPEVLEGFRDAMAAQSQIRSVWCHATYLINLATADPELLGRSRQCLDANLAVADGMGAGGLVLHVGSHKGSGLEGCLDQVAAALAEAVDGSGGGCPILLENAAGAGGTVGRSFEELALVLERADARGASAGLGVCLDTQHLWASGVGYGSEAEADAVMAELDRLIGLERLRCLHLNDSKVPFGANRDRHANIGEGTIGSEALGWLLSHPALDALPALLEVPGEGDGPRAADVEAARAALAEGRARRG